MKRLFILSITFLLLLTGCNKAKSLVSQKSALQQAVDQIAVIVDKQNKMAMKLKKSPEMMAYEKAVVKFNQSRNNGEPDWESLEQILTHSAKTQHTFATANVTLQEMDADAKKVKSTLKSQLSAEENTAVQQTLDNLITLISTESQYTNISIQYYQEISNLYENLKMGIQITDQFLIQLETDKDDAKKKLNKRIGIFQQSWDALQKLP